MGAQDQEPDPRKRVPTVLWLMLAILLAAGLAAVIFATGRVMQPAVVGPPAGAPASPADLAPRPLQRPNATGGSQ